MSRPRAAGCVAFSRCIQSTQTGKCVSVSEISSDQTNRRVVLSKDAVQAETYRSGLHRIHVSRILFARLDYRAFHREIRQRPAVSLNFSQVFKLMRTKYVHNLHRRRYVMTSFTLDPLHSEISWLRGLFSELPRLFGDRSDLFAPQRQSSCTLTRSREPTL